MCWGCGRCAGGAPTSSLVSAGMPTNWPHIYRARWPGHAARQHEGAVMVSRMHYDVLVVGARCAGAATAMLLARAGVRVLLVDRADYGSDTLSTHALMRGGVLQLHRWGVLPQVVSVHTPAIRRTSFHYG